MVASTWVGGLHVSSACALDAVGHSVAQATCSNTTSTTTYRQLRSTRCSGNTPQHWTALCTPPRAGHLCTLVAPFLPELKKSMRMKRNFSSAARISSSLTSLRFMGIHPSISNPSSHPGRALDPPFRFNLYTRTDDNGHRSHAVLLLRSSLRMCRPPHTLHPTLNYSASNASAM